MRERLKRWFDVLLVNVLVLLGGFILFVTFLDTFLQFSDWMIRQNTFLRLLTLFLMSSGLWFFIHKVGGLRLNDLKSKTVFQYPSVWMASIILMLLIVFADVVISRKELSPQAFIVVISNLLVFFISVFFVFICHLLLKRSNDEKTDRLDEINQGDKLDSYKKIVEWAQREFPICSESEARFGHKYVANRVNRVLWGGIAQNVGMIGPFGCGKSSIVNLIFSKKPEDIIYCRIDGWGFRENSAVEHVLQLVIEDLKCYFDCLAIANLPKQYHLAMSSSGNNILAALSCFFQTTRNPKLILEEIDSLLLCVNKRLVVFIEDIDRNTNDATFYNEIASFINVTKSLNQIVFVISIGSKEDISSILTKLCEHNIYIQRIEKSEIIEICSKFIKGILAKYPACDEIVGQRDLYNFLGIKSREEEPLDAYSYLNRDKPIDHIYQLLDTPRKLKTFIRELSVRWKDLYGEVNFCCFFLATVLQTIAPDAYTFVNENIDLLRRLSDKDERGKSIPVLNEKWSRLTENKKWPVVPAKTIIQILFPLWGDDKKPYHGLVISEETLQGFIDDSVTDYWKKINIGETLPEDINDRSILKTIREWKKDHVAQSFIDGDKKMTLAEAVFEIKRRLEDKIEQFGVLFEGEDIRELASELFEIALERFGKDASQEKCPGFVNLWRLSQKKQDYAKHNEWLVGEIRKALKVSLNFSFDLYYYWRHTTRHSVDAKEPTPELRKEVVRLFLHEFQGETDKLLAILDQENPWALFHLVYLERETEPEDWHWLGGVLLNAGKINQKLISSYVACLITKCDLKHDKGESCYDGQIDFDRVKEIFGDEVRPVMELLNNKYEYPELADHYKHAQTKAVIHIAREDAKKFIEEHEDEKITDDSDEHGQSN